MRLAENADYVPQVQSAALEDFEIPDVLAVIAVAGPKDPPKEFTENEEELLNHPHPLALVYGQPFREAFGAPWDLSSAQNECRAPPAPTRS